jgi:hypothetical protein
MKRFFVLLLLIGSTSTQAEIGGYRVEIIVFQNLLANLDAVEVDKLRSFEDVPGLQEESLPDDFEALTDKSQRMEGVWRRLRSSQGYRPLIYASWVQNNIDYYPPFRIHDDVVVDTQIRTPTNMVMVDLQSQDPFEAWRDDFYRLDGSVQLRLSRFLHINLNLEYRVPAAIPQPQNAILTQTDGAIEPAPEFAGHDVYRLKQSRQVKTDRLQYFDSPWFGALVLVIPIAAEPISTQPVDSEQVQ